MNPELHDLLTPQEHYLIMGGTPPWEFVKTDSDFYKPFGLLTKAFTPDEIITKRKELKTLNGSASYYLLGDPRLALKLEDVDTVTLTTIKDPRVVDTTDPLLEPDEYITSLFYSNFESHYRNSNKPFEGRLRDYPMSSRPEQKG